MNPLVEFAKQKKQPDIKTVEINKILLQEFIYTTNFILVFFNGLQILINYI